MTVKKTRSSQQVLFTAGIATGLLWGGSVYAQTEADANIQLYQNYQAAPVASQVTGLSESTIATTPETTSAPPTSFSEPVWVMPEAVPTAPPQGTIPPGNSPQPSNALPAAQPSNPLAPATSSPPSSSITPPSNLFPSPPSNPLAPTTSPSSSVKTGLPPDLAVIATDIQILGGEPDLQQYILNTIKTKQGGQTSEVQLQQDVQTLLDTGLFTDVTVNTRSNPNGVTVVFQVQPIVVQGIKLVGAKVLTPAVAEESFKPQIGTIVSPNQLSQGVQRINQWYTKNGYALARVLTIEPDRSGILTVTVAEGVVGDIKIRYLNKEGKAVDEKGQPIRPRTQEAFVRRQILLKPGQIVQDEAVRADLRRLSDLGIFQNINVGFEGDARSVTVVYNLTEGKSRGFNFGGGYSDEMGVFGSISYTDNNFGGLAQQLSANTQIGVKDIQFDLRFVSPYRSTEPDMPGYGGGISRRQGRSRVFEDDYFSNGQRILERRYGIGFNLNKPLGPTWMGSLAVNYQNISMRDKEGNIFATDYLGNPLTLSSTGTDDLTTIAFTATRDQRDNPTNPGKGSFLSLSTTQTIPIGRGSILGNTLEANYSQYIPVNIIQGLKGEQPQVLAFNIQGGTVFGDLPPYNAYTLGGINSIRGYDFGQAAISRSYVLASAEYRFPIYRFIAGVAFFDVGSGLGTQSDVPGSPGIVQDRPGSGYGGGVGLRFNSPIGIIRTELGINNQGETRFQFGFGQRF